MAKLYISKLMKYYVSTIIEQWNDKSCGTLNSAHPKMGTVYAISRYQPTAVLQRQFLFVSDTLSASLYFVSSRERPWRQRTFRRKALVIARETCVFSHSFKKEHRDWHIKDASWSVYSWTRSVTSRSFSGWDKYIVICILFLVVMRIPFF